MLPTRRSFYTGLAAVSLAGLAGSTGCQVDVGGQTLPSPYYLQDDVQYFPPGPEFKLAREAAAAISVRLGGTVPERQTTPPVHATA